MKEFDRFHSLCTVQFCDENYKKSVYKIDLEIFIKYVDEPQNESYMITHFSLLIEFNYR